MIVRVETIWFATLSLSALAGLLTRRVSFLLIPLGLTALVFLGLDRAWWGGGLGEQWPIAFVAWTVSGVLAAAVGLALRLVVDRVGLGVDGRRWSTRWSALSVAVWLSAAAVYAIVATQPADITAIRNAPGPEVYYLGDSFDGLRLAHAEARGRTTIFVYGDCDIPVGQSEGGCSPPLQLQNVSCPGEPTAVAIFANDRGRSRRAAAALEALRGSVGAPRIAFGANPFGACPTPQTHLGAAAAVQD